MPMLLRPPALAAVILLAGVVGALSEGRLENCTDADGHNPGPCMPGREQCGPSFPAALSPSFHLMDRQGCGENDPNSPVFDPVHGVIHHFYQIHVSTPEGGGNNASCSWGSTDSTPTHFPGDKCI